MTAELILKHLFLKLLGYEDCDYKRQMPLRMGRGIRYYPDYAFFPNAKRGEESALFMLETKFSIRSKKDFSEAFYQARNYACRLLCSRFVLAAKEGMWIFMREKGSFYEDKYINLSWNELKDSDNFHKTLTLIGKEYVLKGIKK